MISEISLQNVFFRYRAKDRWLLKDVSVAFQVGDFIVLNGPNGAGKTTLISLMLGNLTPAHGRISAPHKQVGMLSYLPQSSTYDSVPMRVIDVLTSVFVNSRTFFLSHYKEHALKAKSLLEDLGLESLAYQSFDSLSGGQRQKILLCRVFLDPTPFIFLDEPFSNMDQDSKDIFLSRLQALQKQSAIFLISHDMGFISNHKGPLWYMSNGDLKCYSSVYEMEHDFFHQDVLEEK